MSGKPTYDRIKVMDHLVTEMGKGRSMRQVCQDAGMPAHPTIVLWTTEDPVIADQYARAREALCEHWAEEIVTISDDSSGDLKTDDDGRERMDGEFVQRSRLRVDTRKWLLSKLFPKRFGDKLDVTSGGETIQPGVIYLPKEG